MDLLNLTPAEKVEIQSLIDSAPYVLKVGDFDQRSSFVTLALAKHFKKPHLFNSLGRNLLIREFSVTFSKQETYKDYTF